MKKLILTSSKFSGEIHVCYSAELQLEQFDCSGAELTEPMVKYFKLKVPSKYTNVLDFTTAFQSDSVKAEEVDFEITFDMFWETYDKKINKKRCIYLWNRLKGYERNRAYFGYPKYQRHLQINQWKAKKDPENYLKEKAWETDWSKV